jgi:hypothetical protein
MIDAVEKMLADGFPGSSKADFRKLELLKSANEVRDY